LYDIEGAASSLHLVNKSRRDWLRWMVDYVPGPVFSDGSNLLSALCLRVASSKRDTLA
jgi:hypothetical protein